MKKWTAAAVLILTVVEVEAVERCAVYEEAAAKNVNFHFLPAVAKQPGGFKDFSYSATSHTPVLPAALSGKRARLIGYVSESCCALELVLPDCTRVFYHDNDKVFSLKEAMEKGVEAYPNSGPLKPKSTMP